MRKPATIWMLVCMIFAAAVTYLMLPELVESPRLLNLELGGDASKNYFTFLYHALYGKGLWFTGMNYPYGEHIVYVDGQPALSVTLAYLRDMIHFTREDLIGILYSAIVFGVFLAVIYTYKILRVFKVPYAMAVLFAGCIVVMSPQMQRIFGHYGLSYYCVIPMLFYWSIKYHHTAKLRYTVYILFMGLLMSFIHPYFGAVILIWAVFYAAGYFLLTPGTVGGKVKHVLPLMVTVAAVFGTIQVTMRITDPVKDRPVTPIGVLSNGTTGEDILMSRMSQIWSGLNELYPDYIMKEPGEGSTYLGLAVIIVLITAIVIAVARKIKKRPVHGPEISEEGFSRIWIFMSVASLLLAMGVPFVWGMKWLLDYVPAFKQFRSMGRFSWLFYYTATVLAVILFVHWFKVMRERNKLKAFGFLGLFIILWVLECNGYMNYSRKRLQGARDGYMAFFYDFDWSEFLHKHGHTPTDFQAILLIPYYHVGTEKFTLNTKMDWAITLAMRASLQTGLPMADAMMSRSSWSQALAQAKTGGGPYTDKPLLHADEKPFLVMTYNDIPPDKESAYILETAELIDSAYYFKVYALYPGKALANDRRIADTTAPYYDAMTTGDTCIGCEVPYMVNHFEEGGGEPLYGKSSMPVIKGKEKYIAECRYSRPLAEEIQYEFSAWVKVRTDDPVLPYFILDVFDDNADTLVRHTVEIVPLDSKGMWFRAGKMIKLPKGTKLVKCMVVNNPSPAYIALDELQLRPANATVLSKQANGEGLINNHFYKR